MTKAIKQLNKMRQSKKLERKMTQLYHFLIRLKG